jgi:hypothetical protein
MHRLFTGSHVDAPRHRIPRMKLHLIPTFWLCCCGGKRSAPILPSNGFPNVDTGRPFHAESLRDDHLHPAGQTILIPNLGWYAVSHTYWTILDDEGAPLGVQQKLMRHSDVRTTMNHYCTAYEKTKRRANTLVAGKLLPDSMKQHQEQRFSN